MTLNTYIEMKKIISLTGRAKSKLKSIFGTGNNYNPILPRSIPKIIWIFWEQGRQFAPEIVSNCINTWELHNPNWEIRVLDGESIQALIELPELPETISRNHRANIIRTMLLNKFGGVWIDATCWCLRPLDHWLPVVSQAGFFVFTWSNEDIKFIQPGPSRTLCNWFIASEARNPMISSWERETLNYWKGRLEANHYFWHNDAAEYVLRTDPKAKAVWDRMPKLSAVAPHLAWHSLERGGDSLGIKSAIADGTIPVLKLSWRMKSSLSDFKLLLSDD